MPTSDTDSTSSDTPPAASTSDPAAAKPARKRAPRARKTVAAKEPASGAAPSLSDSESAAKSSEGKKAPGANRGRTRSRASDRSGGSHQGKRESAASQQRSAAADRGDSPTSKEAVKDVKPEAEAAADSRKQSSEASESQRSKQSGGRNRGRGRGGRDRDQERSGHRVTVNNEELRSKAWQVYLAELAEEGVTMFDRGNAQKLAEHSFLLAEVFLAVQERKTGSSPARKSTSRAQREERRPNAKPPAEDSSDGKPAEPSARAEAEEDVAAQ